MEVNYLDSSVRFGKTVTNRMATGEVLTLGWRYFLPGA